MINNICSHIECGQCTEEKEIKIEQKHVRDFYILHDNRATVHSMETNYDYWQFIARHYPEVYAWKMKGSGHCTAIKHIDIIEPSIVLITARQETNRSRH